MKKFLNQPVKLGWFLLWMLSYSIGCVITMHVVSLSYVGENHAWIKTMVNKGANQKTVILILKTDSLYFSKENDK